jgi:subtilisin family serine protease
MIFIIIFFLFCASVFSGDHMILFKKDSAIHVSDTSHIRLLSLEDHNLVFLHNFSKESVSNLVKLNNDSIVSIEDPNQEVVMADSTYSEALDRINQENLPLDRDILSSRNKGNGKEIYVIDSGVNDKHKELKGRVKHLKDFSGDDDFEDKVGHGTAVASLIAGTNVGVAPEATILSIKIFGDSKSTTLGKLAQALDYMVKRQLRDPYKTPRFCDLSLTTRESTISVIIDEYLKVARQNNLLCSVAAGNRASDASEYVPASSSDVVTVGGIDENDKLMSISNYGKDVDMLAPGKKVLVASSDGGYNMGTGTSLSCALVAGAMALAGHTDMEVFLDKYSTEIVKQPKKTTNKLLYIPIDDEYEYRDKDFEYTLEEDDNEYAYEYYNPEYSTHSPTPPPSPEPTAVPTLKPTRSPDTRRTCKMMCVRMSRRKCLHCEGCIWGKKINKCYKPKHKRNRRVFKN